MRYETSTDDSNRQKFRGRAIPSNRCFPDQLITLQLSSDTSSWNLSNYKKKRYNGIQCQVWSKTWFIFSIWLFIIYSPCLNKYYFFQPFCFDKRCGCLLCFHFCLLTQTFACDFGFSFLTSFDILLFSAFFRSKYTLFLG